MRVVVKGDDLTAPAGSTAPVRPTAPAGQRGERSDVAADRRLSQQGEIVGADDADRSRAVADEHHLAGRGFLEKRDGLRPPWPRTAVTIGGDPPQAQPGPGGQRQQDRAAPAASASRTERWRRGNEIRISALWPIRETPVAAPCGG